MPLRHRNLFILAVSMAVFLVSACTETDDERASPGDDALLPVVEDGRWGYIDTRGAVVIRPQFERAWRFAGDLALVRRGGLYGFIHRDGSFAIEPRFTDAWHFSGGLAPVELDTTWAFVDRDGRVVADTQFNLSDTTLVESRAGTPQLHLVSSQGRYGFEAADGRSVIEPQFENAWRFSEGLARVMVGGEWGYIDRNGNLAVDPRFDLAWDFRDGAAMVQVDGNFGYIEQTGRYLWQPRR